MPFKDPDDRREYQRKYRESHKTRADVIIPSFVAPDDTPKTTVRKPQKPKAQRSIVQTFIKKSPDIIQKTPVLVWLCSIGGLILGILALIAVYNTQLRVLQLIKTLQSLSGS